MIISCSDSVKTSIGPIDWLFFIGSESDLQISNPSGVGVKIDGAIFPPP